MNASISRGFPLNETLDLDMGLSLGFGDSSYNKGYYGADATGMNNLLLTAGVPLHPAPMFTITPSLGYSTLLGDPKDSQDDLERDTDAFFFGISAAFRF